jgi:biotin transport system substrate-specific component
MRHFLTSHLPFSIASRKLNSLFYSLIMSLGGAIILTLAARTQIPLFGIPFTLQTFALDYLLLMNPSWALHSSLAYLSGATLGMPILASGIVNPFWLLGPTAGYLIAFPLNCMIYRNFHSLATSYLRLLALLLVGKVVILGVGTLVLSFYIGTTDAVRVGFMPFITAEISKSLFALYLSKKH